MGMSAEDQMQDRLPETGPEDTPAPVPAAPAGETRTYAGKFTTPEALEKAYEESQRLMHESTERAKRLEALVLTPTPGYETYPAQPARQEYVPVQVDDTAGASDFITRADADRIADTKVRAAMARIEQQRQLSTEQQYWRDEFFRRNPDLKDDEDIVWAKTAEVSQRYLPVLNDPVRSRQVMPMILDEVATKTRERLSKIRASAKAEADQKATERAEGQVPGSTGPASPPITPKEQTLDELRQEGIREDEARYEKTRQSLTGRVVR